MLEIWDYAEKGKHKKYKEEKRIDAASNLLLFRTEDPEMPWYGRDPKEIKRDARYQQLTRHEKDLFNRLLDELWISKGALPDSMDFIMSCLEIDDPTEAQSFFKKCLALEIIKRHEGRFYIPELREQFVRATHKSVIRNTVNNLVNEKIDKDDFPF